MSKLQVATPTNAPDPPQQRPPDRARHQPLTMALHWLTVVAVLGQFGFAIAHAQVGDADLRRALLTAHRSLGVLIALLIVVRVTWRLFGMRLPPFPNSMSRFHQIGARLSEWGLYGLLLAQPATGLLQTALRGRPFTLFGIQVPALMAADKSMADLAHMAHELGAYALAGLVLVHASAAILHRVIGNDGVLDSMLPIRASDKRGR